MMGPEIPADWYTLGLLILALLAFAFGPGALRLIKRIISRGRQ
jgi:hypothetical protein